MRRFTVRTTVGAVEASNEADAAKQVDDAIRSDARNSWEYDVTPEGSDGRKTVIVEDDDHDYPGAHSGTPSTDYYGNGA